MAELYPQSKEEAGAHYWAVLKNIAAQYPNSPTRDDRLNTKNLIKSIVSKFTCRECIDHAFEFMATNPIDLNNREGLMRWICSLQNNANIHSGKDPIDCEDFVLTSLGEGECQTCSITPIAAPVFRAPAVRPPVIQMPSSSDPHFASVLHWQERYPSIMKARKKALSIQSETPLATTATVEQQAVQPPASMNEMSQTYPSLMGFEEAAICKEEELDGVLKPLDGIYAFPASVVGIKPHEFNLAYTPEMLTNLVTLLTQMYLTNFGSLLTTVVSSLGLFGVALLGKGSLSHYDNLFVQNVTASMLFHALNFINPRIKDEILPTAQKFFEGVTTMDFEKVKSSMLFNYQSAEEKSTTELLDMMKTKNGLLDMDKLKIPKTNFLAGAATGGGSSIRDLQIASQGAYDRFGGGGLGGGSNVSKASLESLYNSRGPGHSSPTLRDYTYSGGTPAPDFGLLGSMDDKFGWVLDNNLL